MMMVFSTQKPARIVILSTHDDIRNGKCTVRYAFRFAIQEVTQTEIFYNEQGIPEERPITGCQYEEITDELTIPLFMKPALPMILESAYINTVPMLEQNLQYSKTEIPKEIA